MSPKPFVVGEYVVYPSHGVGQIAGYELQEIADQKIELMVISFDKDRMILRIPIGKAKASGLRALSAPKDMQKALESLKIKTKSRRTMWSRRAQEYENKINSGDPASIAEVIRDLYRSATQPDQSYSERQIYQAAIDRFARELAAIEQTDEPAAISKVEEFLKVA
ncbi:CarD family transcriptional regulator [Candidatus Paracaedibacter symbiosus]|uniref:CarD family transcriptional regulator n=1 Tax=Candidatus Paracaedibacter symbiosus TaxID=244582 RepID=UPI0005095F45|nr:CarD family transcriptional regulator [Candidatus Paracaedibacter symbiosus]